MYYTLQEIVYNVRETSKHLRLSKRYITFSVNGLLNDTETKRNMTGIE